MQLPFPVPTLIHSSSSSASLDTPPQIKLTDSLVTSLSVSSFDDYQLSYVGGLVVVEGEALPTGASTVTLARPDVTLEQPEQQEQAGEAMQVDAGADESASSAALVPAPAPPPNTTTPAGTAMLDRQPPQPQL